MYEMVPVCVYVCVGHVFVFFLAISPLLSFALEIIKATPTTTTSGNNGQRKTTADSDVVGPVFSLFLFFIVYSLLVSIFMLLHFNA